MLSWLTNYVNNIAEGIRKYGHHNKKCETCEIKYKDCKCCLKYTNFKNGLMEEKYLCGTKYYQ